jgi:hypothetical protein
MRITGGSMDIVQVHNCCSCQTFLGWRFESEEGDDAIDIFESQIGSYSNEETDSSKITVFFQ